MTEAEALKLMKAPGDLRVQRMAELNFRHGYAKRSGRVPEYNVWIKMIRRCENPKDKDFPRYGKRGIYVCAKWRNSFAAFLDDMGSRPTSKHQIERINNNEAYHPWNCRWATAREQANNRRSNVFITWNGETYTVSEWSQKSGIGLTTIFYRLAHGWPIETVLTKARKYDRTRSSL